MNLLSYQFPSTDVAGNRQVDEGWEYKRSSVEDDAAQDEMQNLQYVSMGYYDMANDYSPPYRHRDHIIGDNARVVQGVPPQANVIPPAPVCTVLTFTAYTYLTIPSITCKGD